MPKPTLLSALTESLGKELAGLSLVIRCSLHNLWVTVKELALATIEAPSGLEIITTNAPGFRG